MTVSDLHSVKRIDELTIGAYRMNVWIGEEGEPLAEWLGRELCIPFDEERTGRAIIEITWSEEEDE